MYPWLNISCASSDWLPTFYCYWSCICFQVVLTVLNVFHMYSMSIYWGICSQCSSWDQDCSWELRATVFITSRCSVSGSFHQPSMLGDIHSGLRRSSDCDWLFGLQGLGDRKWHASHFPEWRLEFVVWWNMLWTCWKMSMNYAACRHSLFRSSGYFLTVWQRAMMAAWGSAQITLPVLTQVYCKWDLSNFSPNKSYR